MGACCKTRQPNSLRDTLFGVHPPTGSDLPRLLLLVPPSTSPALWPSVPPPAPCLFAEKARCPGASTCASLFERDFGTRSSKLCIHRPSQLPASASRMVRVHLEGGTHLFVIHREPPTQQDSPGGSSAASSTVVTSGGVACCLTRGPGTHLPSQRSAREHLDTSVCHPQRKA